MWIKALRPSDFDTQKPHSHLLPRRTAVNPNLGQQFRNVVTSSNFPHLVHAILDKDFDKSYIIDIISHFRNTPEPVYDYVELLRQESVSLPKTRDRSLASGAANFIIVDSSRSINHHSHCTNSRHRVVLHFQTRNSSSLTFVLTLLSCLVNQKSIPAAKWHSQRRRISTHSLISISTPPVKSDFGTCNRNSIKITRIYIVDR